MTLPVSGPINLDEKIAIVTGGSRGIGQAICIALAREGANVAVCDILSTEETLSKIQKHGKLTLGLQCNISEKDQVRKVIDEVITLWGRVDILVNNAAILGTYPKDFKDIGVEEWDHLLEINLRGTFLMTQAVWPHMIKDGGGKIVCIGSLAGRMGGIIAGPHYSASKGGIHAFVKWAAKNGAKLGIYVNGIAPGPIRTDMTKDAGYTDDMTPLGRVGHPEDIAEAAVFLASQASNFITGNIMDVNGGMY